MRTSDLDGKVVEAAYKRWAPIYDVVRGMMTVNGRRAAADAARAARGKILEIELGVGTGLSLDDCDSGTEVIGIGFAAAVEQWAAKRTRKLGLRSEFPFARLLAWARSNREALRVERRKVAPFGIYSPLSFERTGTLAGQAVMAPS